MNTNLQPPPLPVQAGRPQRRPPLIGRFTKFGLAVIAVLFLVVLLQSLRVTPDKGRAWEETKSLLCSPDPYLALVVFLVDSLSYCHIIKCLYPTTRATLRGLALAATLGGHHHNPQPVGMMHFFMIFVFPFLVIAAGLAEYQWLKVWLLPQ
jgi:hypothetical protein